MRQVLGIMKITTANRGGRFFQKGDGSGELGKTHIGPLDKMLASQKAGDAGADRRNFVSDALRLGSYPATFAATLAQEFTVGGHGWVLFTERAANGTIMTGLAAVFAMYGAKVASTLVKPDGKFKPNPDFKLSPAMQKTVENIAYGSFALGSAGLIAVYQLAHASLLVASTLLGLARSVGNIGQAAGILGYERIQKAKAAKQGLVWAAGKGYSAYDWVVTMLGASGIVGNAIFGQVGPVGEGVRDIGHLLGSADHPVTPPVQGEFEHPWEGK